MIRPIDADKLKKDILDIYEQEFPTATGMFDRFVTEIVPSIINMQPTVDAVPVVRCKDCRYATMTADGKFAKSCKIWTQARYFNADYFCADGARKKVSE